LGEFKEKRQAHPADIVLLAHHMPLYEFDDTWNAIAAELIVKFGLIPGQKSEHYN